MLDADLCFAFNVTVLFITIIKCRLHPSTLVSSVQFLSE